MTGFVVQSHLLTHSHISCICILYFSQIDKWLGLIYEIWIDFNRSFQPNFSDKGWKYK